MNIANLIKILSRIAIFCLVLIIENKFISLLLIFLFICVVFYPNFKEYFIKKNLISKKLNMVKNKKENVRKVFIISGAGISQESGIQTFRDQNGMWENHKIDDVCNYFTWKRNFNLVHEFYNKRRVSLKDVSPNEAHMLIASLQKKYGIENVINITTNIDDLFERADVKNTLYLHGNLTKIKDTTTDSSFDIGYTNFDYEKDLEKKYKPDVIFFHESAPNYKILEKNKFLMNDNDIVITIGMSFVVVKPERIFSNYAKTINVNINLDEETHTKWKFNKSMTSKATSGLKEVVEDLKLL